MTDRCPTCGADRVLKASASLAEQSDRDGYVVYTKRQLAALLQMGLTTFDGYRKQRSHPAIKQLDGPGHPRFCRRTADAWIASQGSVSSDRRYFRTASQRGA